MTCVNHYTTVYLTVVEGVTVVPEPSHVTPILEPAPVKTIQRPLPINVRGVSPSIMEYRVQSAYRVVVTAGGLMKVTVQNPRDSVHAKLMFKVASVVNVKTDIITWKETTRRVVNLASVIRSGG